MPLSIGSDLETTESTIDQRKKSNETRVNEGHIFVESSQQRKRITLLVDSLFSSQACTAIVASDSLCLHHLLYQVALVEDWVVIPSQAITVFPAGVAAIPRRLDTCVGIENIAGPIAYETYCSENGDKCDEEGLP